MAAEPTFYDLASAGQARLQAGDRQGAIPFYVAATRIGCDNDRTLGVVHSQLGNCLLSQGMVELAIQHHQADLAIARKLSDSSNTAKSWANLGNAYKTKKDYQAAVRCYEQQLLLGMNDLIQTEPRVQTKALANLGHTYVAAGMELLQSGAEERGCELLLRGRDSFRLHLLVSEKMKDFDGIGQACGYLGNLFEQTGNPAGAVSFYKRRLAMARKLEDLAAEGRAHCNLGNVYQKLGKIDRAIDAYLIDLDIAIDMKDRRGEALTCGNLFAAFQKKGDAKRTLTYLNRAVSIHEELRDAENFLRCIRQLGRVQMIVGDYKAAVSAFERMAFVANATKNGAGFKEANEALQDAKRAVQCGTKVSPAEASATLAETALGNEDPQQKWTVKGTVSRMFGRKFKIRSTLEGVTAPGVEDADPSVNKGSEGDRQDGVVLRRKPSIVGVRSRMKRLSSIFSKSPSNRDQVYLPSGTPSAVEVYDEDDSNIEFDELIFTLSQLEDQARRRQTDDLRQLGNAIVNPMFSVPDVSAAPSAGPETVGSTRPAVSVQETSFTENVEDVGAHGSANPAQLEVDFLDDIEPTSEHKSTNVDNSERNAADAKSHPDGGLEIIPTSRETHHGTYVDESPESAAEGEFLVGQMEDAQCALDDARVSQPAHCTETCAQSDEAREDSMDGDCERTSLAHQLIEGVCVSLELDSSGDRQKESQETSLTVHRDTEIAPSSFQDKITSPQFSPLTQDAGWTSTELAAGSGDSVRMKRMNKLVADEDSSA